MYLCVILLLLFSISSSWAKTAEIIKPFKQPMNFVTVADQEHYPWLLVLFESISENNPGKNINILVFDIGLEQEQINAIQTNYSAKVCALEMVHPDLTKKFVVRSNGRLARGWYAWKPVAIKQAFDHFSYFLYIDSGKRLTGPSDTIFHAIVEHGYFLFDCGHTIDPMTTKKVKNKFNLEADDNKWILDAYGIEAGIQGLSQKVYLSYVLPMYELAHEIDWFADDGSAPWGFGGCRHDQTLFSILARFNNFTVHKVCGDGPNEITIDSKSVLFNRNWYFQFKNYKDNPTAKDNKLI